MYASKAVEIICYYTYICDLQFTTMARFVSKEEHTLQCPSGGLLGTRNGAESVTTCGCYSDVSPFWLNLWIQ